MVRTNNCISFFWPLPAPYWPCSPLPTLQILRVPLPKCGLLVILCGRLRTSFGPWRSMQSPCGRLHPFELLVFPCGLLWLLRGPPRGPLRCLVFALYTDLSGVMKYIVTKHITISTFHVHNANTSFCELYC